jgi:hypothetical protein
VIVCRHQGKYEQGATLLNYTPPHQDQLYTPDYVRAVVESAGRTMMMMPATGTRPGGYVSCMPDIADDEWFAYAANDARVRYRATLEQHNEWGMVQYQWLPLIRLPQFSNYRKAINFRMLRYPDTERPVYNWVRLGRKLNENRKTVKIWYIDGIRHLIDQLNKGP